MPTPLISTADAAEVLGVDRSTVARLVRDGKLKPAAKGHGLRGAMFFYPSSVKRLKMRLGGEQ